MSIDSNSSAAIKDFVDITWEKIDLEALVQAVSLPYCGAISTFIGMFSIFLLLIEYCRY